MAFADAHSYVTFLCPWNDKIKRTALLRGCGKAERKQIGARKSIVTQGTLHGSVPSAVPDMLCPRVSLRIYFFCGGI